MTFVSENTVRIALGEGVATAALHVMLDERALAAIERRVKITPGDKDFLPRLRRFSAFVPEREKQVRRRRGGKDRLALRDELEDLQVIQKAKANLGLTEGWVTL